MAKHAVWPVDEVGMATEFETGVKHAPNLIEVKGARFASCLLMVRPSPLEHSE